MHPVIYLNKTMVEAANARVAPVSSAMLYGRGVFTTLAIYNSVPTFWSAHWQRLHHDAQKLSIDCTDFDENNVEEALNKLIAVNGVTNGRARVILLARSGRDFWRTHQPGSRKTDLLIMTGNQQRTPAAGMTLAVSPFRVNTFSPLFGIKSLNYLERVLSWEEAQARQFDEAVMLNERGEVVSATMSNIFWVREGKIHAPTLSTGAYPGVTREVVIKLASQQFIPVVEGAYELTDITEAEEIFLTSASLGVAAVTTFDFHQYSLTQESISSRLRNAFREQVER